jgi:hypothetical protein
VSESTHTPCLKSKGLDKLPIAACHLHLPFWESVTPSTYGARAATVKVDYPFSGTVLPGNRDAMIVTKFGITLRNMEQVFLSPTVYNDAFEEYLDMNLFYPTKYLYLTKDDGLHYWRSTLNEALPAAEPPHINSLEHNLLLDGHPIHNAMDLHGYHVDSDWATCPKTRRSFTGVCVRLTSGTIAYKSKLQPTVAQSSTETEFMGTSDFGQALLFVRSVLWDIGVPQAAASILYKDNNACIAIMAQKPTPRTRHMDIKYHVLIEWVERDLFQLTRINTSMNLADYFTKQLGRTLFHRHVDYILGKVPPTYSCAFDRFCLGLHKYTTTTPLVQKPACSPLPNIFAAVAAHLWTSWSRVIGSIL